MECNWIIDALNTTGISAVRLEMADTTKLLSCIKGKFCSEQLGRQLWKGLLNSVSIWCPEGWRLMPQFCPTDPILLFVESDALGAFRFTSGEDLLRVLEETPGFEIYITNETVDFLLCHNDHDYVIGAGTAKSWVESLINQTECNQDRSIDSY